MVAYYNEIERYCCDWLSNLMDAGEIPAGRIDDRDLWDVEPLDLTGYDQVHLCAGLGGWPAALRRAGWADDRPVWTVSCPCQPFSQAGKREGFVDERHLWPAVFWHISQCRPDRLIGEQVSSRDGLDLVCSDLENAGYACGATVFPSAGVGAPNIRHRIWWVADRNGAERLAVANQGQRGRLTDGGLVDAESGGRGEHRLLGGALGGGEDTGQSALAVAAGDGSGRLGLFGSEGLPHSDTSHLRGARWWQERRAAEQSGGPRHPWRELEWIACSDGRQRPVESALFELAPGLSADLGYLRADPVWPDNQEKMILSPLKQRVRGDVQKLRAFGNAINVEAAAAVITAWMGHLRDAER